MCQDILPDVQPALYRNISGRSKKKKNLGQGEIDGYDRKKKYGHEK